MFLTNSTDYSVWGSRRYDTPTRVKFDPDGYETRAGVVASAIARKNRLDVANLRKDCQRIDRNGNVEAVHYQATLGKALKTGGYSVDGEVWFAIKR